MSEDIITITNSELSAMLDCPKKWDFRYRQRLVPRKPSSKLDLGSAAHNAIETFYEHPDMGVARYQAIALADIDKMFKEHKDNGGYPYEESNMQEMRDLLISIVRMYVDFARANDDFEIVSLEEEFDIPAINPYTGTVHENLRVMGKIDGWCTVRGRNLILEHKTAATAPTNDFWWPYLNQIDFYTYAMQRKHSVQFRGSYINILVKKIPGIPKLLQRGGLSQKAIVTTPEIYLREIDRHGLDPEDYRKILKKLEANPNPFIVRKPVFRHSSDIQQIEETIWWALRRKWFYLNKNKEGFYVKNKSDTCGWKCSYKELCIDDTPEMRALYKIRDSEHSELSGENSGIEV